MKVQSGGEENPGLRVLGFSVFLFLKCDTFTLAHTWPLGSHTNVPVSHLQIHGTEGNWGL